MNIDFVKWKVGYAEGFSLKSENIEKGEFSISIPIPFTFLKSWCNHFRTDIWKYIYSPLLNQKAIEGINQKGDYIIEQSEQGCFLLNSSEDFSGDTYDLSKESILKYVWEQEKGDG